MDQNDSVYKRGVTGRNELKEDYHFTLQIQLDLGTVLASLS